MKRPPVAWELAATWLLALTAWPATALAAQARTLPFDPLTVAERTAAEQLARADPGVLRLMAGRDADVASLDLFVPKPRDDGRPLGAHADSMGRMADLVFSVLEGRPHFGVWVRVDLQARRVIQVARLDDDPEHGSAQVPFAPREVERARTLVLASPEGRLLASDSAAWVLEYRPLGPGNLGEPCFRSRCMGVLFRHGSTYLRTFAMVNLETGAVRFQAGER